MEGDLLSTILYFDVLLFSVVVVLFGSITILRSSKTSKIRNKEYFLNKSSKALNNYLISTTENEGLRHNSVDDFQLKRIKKSLYTKNRKDCLIGHLLSLKKELFGEMDTALDHVYHYLALEKHSLMKAKSWNAHYRIQGFQELSFFKSKKGLSPILKHVNSKRNLLRQEAQVALVKLSTKDPLSFIRKLQYDISNWEKLQLHYELTKTSFKYDTKFEAHLDCPFASVRAFMITLCTLFKRIESIPTIRKLLETESEEDVLQAGLIAIREMGDDQDIMLTKDLMRKFTGAHLTMEGLKTLAAIEDPEDLVFIESYLTHDNSDVQFQAMYALNEITFEVGHYLSDKHFALSPAHRQMVSHIEEPLN